MDHFYPKKNKKNNKRMEHGLTTNYRSKKTKLKNQGENTTISI